MAWTTGDRVMTLRRRWHVVDVVVEMLDGWRRHLSGRNAWVLAFFSFLSIFPLMLAAVTILGFVLQNNQQLQQDIVESAAADIPVLGDTLVKDPEAISGSFLALAIGLGGALWSSTKAFVGLQSALDDTWEVEIDDRDSFQVKRGKALVGIAIIGASQVASVTVASIVGAVDLHAVGEFALIVATGLLNVLVITAMYRVLTSYDATWGDVWFGAVFAGVVLTGLQYFGTTIVRHFAESENTTEGLINSVLALLTWLSLIGITIVMCAELNAARKRLRDGVMLHGSHLDIAIRT